MRESQYHIPETGVLNDGGADHTPEQQHEQYHAAERVHFAYPHESEVAGNPSPQDAVLHVANRIDWYRNEALHTPLKKDRTLGSRILEAFGVVKKAPLHPHEYIDEESLVGGRLFGEQARFWLHPSGEAMPTVRDWYFTMFVNQQEQTLHYQVDVRGIHKIYNGREYAFAPGELDRFIAATAAYEQRIVADVYHRTPAIFPVK